MESLRLGILAAILLATTPALALTDQYGRTITCTGTGPVTCNTGDGTSVQAATPAQAMGTINGMAPASWSPPVPAPTVAQLAANLLAAGLTITSTSTPALSGTYAIDASAQGNIASVQTYILSFPGTFPSGTTQPWLDINGAPHTFTSTAQFTAFAKVAAQIKAQLDLYGAGAIPTAPTMSAAIP